MTGVNLDVSPPGTPKGRRKSHTILNALLAHQRQQQNEGLGLHDRSGKKVSFHTNTNESSINSSQACTSILSSAASSNNLLPSESLNEDETPARSQKPQKNRSGGLKKTPSNSKPAPGRKHSLKRYVSYPYSGERMVVTQSLDSQMALAANGGETDLPEFNKRPLTDTPIVSSVASPITRDQLSDCETDEEYDKIDQRTTQSVPIITQTKPESPERPELYRKTKNISHLNLTDLNGESVSETTEKDSFFSQPKHPHDETNLSSVSPMTSTTDTSSRALQMDKETKDNLLRDVPLAMQQEFEKTPSLEHLKTLLLTKPPPPARKAYTLNIPGQTSSKTSPDGHIAQVDVGSKLVIVMVGLPARGKLYITNKLTRYLNWLQHDCRVFNVGNTRRNDKENNLGPETNPLPDTNTPNNESQSNLHTNSPLQVNSPPKATHNADFFSPDNKSSTSLREKWAMDTLDQLLNYVIDGTGSVGIFDATNSTKQRRVKVLKRIQQRSKGELKVLFLESICSDPAIIESNIRLKLSGPDYRDMDTETALKDFVGRLHNYEKAYETIDDSEEDIPGYQYVKMIDVGKKVVSYNVQGFLASQTIYFLLNFNLCERQIWITRHGESVDNLSGKIGGDLPLTQRGKSFLKALSNFMNFQRQQFRKDQLERFSSRLELRYNSLFGDGDDEPESKNIDNIPTEPNFLVWTSMLCRAVETGQYFNEQLFSIKEMRMLNELGGGKFEGLTYDDIQRKYPKEFQSRLKNKLAYRYPGVGGESYLDVLTRLRPLITEIERTTDHLLIVLHRVVLRVLLAYFLNLDKSSIGELDVPLHTLYCLESKPYGTDYRMFEYDEALNWFVKVEPEHQKNMKEVGVVFKERKYSVVPTAPPSRRKSRTKTIGSAAEAVKSGSQPNGSFSLRRSLSFGSRPHGNGTEVEVTGSTNDERLSAQKLEDLNRLRKPHAAEK